MRRIEALLQREIGLDAATLGPSLVDRSVRARMKLHGLESAGDYLQLLLRSRGELAELTESVVVTETWFFRDLEPFQIFGKIVLEQWLPQRAPAPLRILCVPCSSGEEPYSLAMTLLDVIGTEVPVEIQAVDISRAALARAERASYGKNSFRGKELGFRDRYFTTTDDGYVLNSEVTRLVKFEQHNLLADDFLQGRAPYDFIFCRNLLIYFDRTTQLIALGKLHQLLTPDGLLFVGAAELPLVAEGGFVSIKRPHAFACRKRQAGAPDSETAVPAQKSRSRTVRGLKLPGAAELLPVINAPEATPAELVRARQLADSGELAAAAALCKKYLVQHHSSAEAYYLLGLVKDASNDSEALNLYRKAIYLQPDHYEALVHAALLLERSGDFERAKSYRSRADRIKRQPQIS
jgi:chemotaxis protein methyltransferase WspC